jgi:hypothetical protein
MNMLSTGMPSTLKSYKTLCNLFFGPDSEQAAFIAKKISESPNGEDEEVIADESQMLYLLQSFNNLTALEELL